MALKLTVTEENGVTLSSDETVTLTVSQQGPQGPSGAGGGVTDHGALTGLGDDDHPQYALAATSSDLVSTDATTLSGTPRPVAFLPGVSSVTMPSTVGSSAYGRPWVLANVTGGVVTVNAGSSGLLFGGSDSTFTLPVRREVTVSAINITGVGNLWAVQNVQPNPTAGGGIGALDIVAGSNITVTPNGTNTGVTIAATAGGTGDVVGPASSVDGRAVLFDGTTGKLLKQASAAPVLVGDAPTTHKTSHATGGTDALAPSDIGAVPTSRTVAGKALSADVTLTASDVSAVPTTRTVNSKALSADITLTASDVGAVATGDASVTNARVPQWRRLTFSDAAYNLGSAPSPAVSGSVVLQQTGTLTAARIVTLPAASAVPAGGEVIINAGAGCSATNTVTIQRSGSDLINGASTSLVIGTAWGQRRLVSDGVSAWVHDDGLMRRSQSLADVASVSSARTNLGLGTAATADTGTGATNVILGNDARLSDSRAPSGSAGGDLSGTYPNPTVASGLAVSKLANGTRGQALVSGASAPEWRQITPPLPLPAAANDWVPIFVAGSLGSITTGGTATASNSKALYHPFWVGKRIGVSGIGIAVSVGNAGASAVVRMGIHSDSSGRPGAVVQDAGTASASAAAKELTFTEVFLDQGWYWLVFVFQNLDTSGTNPAIRAFGTSGSSATATSVPTRATQGDTWTATVSGALASNPSVSSNNGQSTPAFWLKVSTP